LKWVEEPIARDDVLGYVELSETFADADFGFACGEQAASPVIFKQLLKSGAIKFCQIDAVRVAGVNDVMAIILMAAKFGVPVCPHGGGIALCNMIQHYGVWDQIAVSGHSDTQLVEYIDFLQDAVQHPVAIAIVNVDMLRARHDTPTVGAVILKVGEGVQVMILVQLSQRSGVHGHVLCPVLQWRIALQRRATPRCYGPFVCIVVK